MSRIRVPEKPHPDGIADNRRQNGKPVPPRRPIPGRRCQRFGRVNALGIVAAGPYRIRVHISPTGAVNGHACLPIAIRGHSGPGGTEIVVHRGILWKQKSVCACTGRPKAGPYASPVRSPPGSRAGLSRPQARVGTGLRPLATPPGGACLPRRKSLPANLSRLRGKTSFRPAPSQPPSGDPLSTQLGVSLGRRPFTKRSPCADQ
jgi:hypothetical protein